MPKITPIEMGRPRVLEFFAGIGLARMGLEKAGFSVVWANDIEKDKKSMYDRQFGESTAHSYSLGDIGEVGASDLPGGTSLAWASSPCTDLSLAGTRKGLAGSQSGTFWHFVRILEELGEERPQSVVLENVTGLATSHGGEDIRSAIKAFNELGYSVDVLAIDARRFLPQSRPRIFLVGSQKPPEANEEGPSELRPEWMQWIFADPELRTHRAVLPSPPAPNTGGFSETVEEMNLNDSRWWDSERTEAFFESLSPIQRARVLSMQKGVEVKYRTAYRRTRKGKPVWEVRPDDISGCLRTARGGSSKQAVVRLGKNRFQVRWMTPLEYARLMGAAEYDLSAARTNQALFGFGDAVAVPVVEWLAENYLLPLIAGTLEAPAFQGEVRKYG
ncbi:cytosine methyltransferase [Corynebacterium phocae]|uniref:DNA (cytosine-5-)-methyltransferase n=1 Tax=Corynebacterium phocae TaxID=161895 RepID=A0A1L7D1X8_9CORY|nr:DNA cytosine methyltransferase [Corynebacterium phocae]APT92077.1 cytosine methyltransferase [Corynebacterium phocae]KAA8726462.1 DNA cytosine methyltransferase [Corynebacterium phocae]